MSISPFDKTDQDTLIKIVKSDRWTMGQEVDKFEKAFAKYHGMKHAIKVNSGSSANLVAMASLLYRSRGRLKPGDEVIVPAIAWSTTYSPLHQYGLKIRIVDVDLRTLTYDMDELEKSITKKTKMIVAVSILGNPCNYAAMKKLCKKKNIILFEDNCESLGARSKGKLTGTFGILNTFSFFFTHHISTIEGGMILTNDHELFSLCRALRNHGWTRDQDTKSKIFTTKGDDFFEAYRFILPGYNLRPMEFSGALGSNQLKKLTRFVKARRKNAKLFEHNFADDPRFQIQEELHGESSWFSFTMIVDPKIKISRTKVLDQLKRKGIEYRCITGSNILDHDVVKQYDHSTRGCPNAGIVHRQGFFVANGPKDLRKEIDYLKKSLEVL